jgi:DNA-binding NarL/FixJ family response regulator
MSKNNPKGLLFDPWGLRGSYMITVAVVAPALAVRAGLRALLQTGDGIEVVAEAAGLLDFLPQKAEIDVLILALEGAADLKRFLPAGDRTAVLFLSEGDLDIVQLLSALHGRAWGVLPFDTSAEELLAAVGALHEGLLVGLPAMMEPLLGRLLHTHEIDAEELVEPLTEREAQVLQLLAQGMANKQIAVALGISEHTVKFHVSSIYAKFGATSRTEAVRIGVRKGWIVL